MVRLIERLPKRLRDEIGLYDAMLAFYHGLIAFDHVQHRLWIVRNVYTAGNGGTLRARYNAAVSEIRHTRKLLEQPVPAEQPRKELRGKSGKLRVRSNVRPAQYYAAVRKAKQYIRAGDIFQVVLSQRFSAKTKAHPFEIYRELRALNPSPYLFYLQMNDVAVVGSSPERLVKVQGRDVSIAPSPGHSRVVKTKPKISVSKRNCWPVKKNAPSTSCSSISAATISAAFAITAASRWNSS